MVLDKPCDKDQVFESDGYKIIIHKELAKKISSIEIFYKEGISKSGFRVLTDIIWKFDTDLWIGLRQNMFMKAY